MFAKTSSESRKVWGMIEPALVYVVDDDPEFAASLARLLRRSGYSAEPFSNPQSFLAVYDCAPAACVITDMMMGEVNGFEFAQALRKQDSNVALIFMTAWPSTSAAVDSVRRLGVFDYLEKPVDERRLLQAVEEGVRWSFDHRAERQRIACLTTREQQVFSLLVQGYAAKEVARKLGISHRTVEDHRAQIAAKTGARTLAAMIALSGGPTVLVPGPEC